MIRSLFVQLSRESFVYGLSAACAKLVGLILVPIYTRLLAPDDYGLLGLITTGTSILTSLLILGLDAATALRFYQTEDAQERRVITSTFLYFELVLASGVCAGLFILAEPIARLGFGDVAVTPYIQLGVATVPFATWITLFLDVARLLRLPARYLILSVGNLLLTAVIILIAVVGLHWGVIGVLWGTLLGNVVFSGIGWWFTRLQYTRLFSSAILRRMLLLGLPLVPATVAYWTINFSNRWFLASIISLEQAAIYGVAANLAAPVVLIVTAFQIAWGPFSLSIARNTAAEPVYARTLLYYLAVTFGTLLLLTLFAEPLILLIATPFYLPAAQVLALVGMSSVASGAYYIVATGVNLTGRTLHIGWTTVVAAGVNIGLNLALIPAFGIVGAAVAGLVANCIPVVLLYIVAQRLYYIPYDLLRVSLLTVGGAAFLAVATLLHDASPALDLALRGGLLLGFGAALLLLGVIRVRDLQELQRLVRGAFRRSGSA